MEDEPGDSWLSSLGRMTLDPGFPDDEKAGCPAAGGVEELPLRGGVVEPDLGGARNTR